MLGAAVSKEGFPIATEIFKENSYDSPTFREMLGKINKRVNVEGKTLVFDREIGTKPNMEFLRSQEKKYKWVMASKYWELTEEEEKEIENGEWDEILLKDKVAGCKDPKVKIKLLSSENKRKAKKETVVLVFSEGRKKKDCAIRESQEKKIEVDLKGLDNRIKIGNIKDTKKIWQAIGRIKERYPRVSRYYDIELKEDGTFSRLFWEKNKQKLKKVQEMDGVYLLRTNKIGIDGRDI